MNGEPSYSTADAPTARAETNQFHIIQPVYREVKTILSFTQKSVHLNVKTHYMLSTQNSSYQKKVLSARHEKCKHWGREG